MHHKLFMLLFVVFSSGCSLRGGLVRDSITSVQLDDAGFEYVQTGVQATMSRGSIFCSIAIPPNDLYARLMSALHDQAQLRRNETFVNLREDIIVTSIIGLYCNETVTLSADVIRFTNASTGSADYAPTVAAPLASSFVPEGSPPPVATPPTQIAPPPAPRPKPKPRAIPTFVYSDKSFWLTCGSGQTIRYSRMAEVKLTSGQKCTFTQGAKSKAFQLMPGADLHCNRVSGDGVRCTKKQ